MNDVPYVKTIILIDDDPDDIELLREAILAVRTDVKCVICNEPRVALDIVNRRRPPHLVFVDINMPTYTGFEVLKDFRSVLELNGVPVAMLSTSISVVDAARLKSMGAQYTLEKPFSFDGYLRMLRPILEKI